MSAILDVAVSDFDRNNQVTEESSKGPAKISYGSITG